VRDKGNRARGRPAAIWGWLASCFRVARPHGGTASRTRVQIGPHSLQRAGVPADAEGMEIEQAAAYHVQAMMLNGARAVLEQAQAAPVPANAPATERADVILQLSAAAQTLVASSG
jgi:hypothetical protein